LPRKISQFLQKQVRKRAKYLCEYCHADERWQFVPFTIDHIIPTSKENNDKLENLALACFHCNRYKSNHEFVEGVPIFNPRKMNWHEHFSWSDDFLEIVSKTKTGQITIDLLQLNRPRIIQIRKDDILVNRHPPESD
jgi:hypothetical protein